MKKKSTHNSSLIAKTFFVFAIIIHLLSAQAKATAIGFGYTNTFIHVGDTVHFVNTSAGFPSTQKFLWNFGFPCAIDSAGRPITDICNDTVLGSLNKDHVFLFPGTYKVKLRATYNLISYIDERIITVYETNVAGCLANDCNLLTNGDFEQFNFCPPLNITTPPLRDPVYLGQGSQGPFPGLTASHNWFFPTWGSPDLWFNDIPFPGCAGTRTPVFPPGLGLTFNGGAMVGMQIYGGSQDPNPQVYCYREYINQPLTENLFVGKPYRIRIHARLRNSPNQCQFQIGFTRGPVTDFNNPGDVLTLPPAGSQTITSPNVGGTWETIDMCISPTICGLDHIVIGNFKTDWNTTTIPAHSVSSEYLLVDSIFVYALNGLDACVSNQCQPFNGFINLTPPCYIPETFNSPCGPLAPITYVAPFSYQWSNGANTQSITNLLPGNYSVTVTDANLLTISENYTIGQGTTPPAPVILQTGCNTFDVQSPDPNSNYLWQTSTGVFAPGPHFVFNYTTTVTITCTVTDLASCCTNESSVTVSPIVISGTVTPSCITAPCGAISTTVTGGTPPYTYLWSNAQPTQNISSLPPGTYTVTVTDNVGCTATQSFVVADECYTIEKTATPSTTYAGQTVTFTVTVCNHTCSPQNVSITDLLPLPNFVSTTPIFPFPFAGSIPVGLPCTTFTYTGYFINVGICPDPSVTNTVTMVTPTGTLTDQACVNVLKGCPMIVYGTSDCIVGDDVPVNIGIHNLQTDVTQLKFDLIYPNFIDPPCTGCSLTSPMVTGNFTGQINFASSTIGTPINYVIDAGVQYKRVPIILTYNSPGVTVGPPIYPHSFSSILFTYLNVPARPLGKNSFKCWVIDPNNNSYFTEAHHQNGTVTPLWTQASSIFFHGCADAPQLDASFNIAQTPCTGDVIVTGNYVSPTAIHVWDFGDGRATPINGAQSCLWQYYDPYTDNTGYTQPGLTPGNYTFPITHTVIDNGVSTSLTQQVVLYPSCCQQNISIHDGEVSSMYGGVISGTTVDIEGKFYIDQPFVFTNCTITMEPGSEIIVQTPNMLRIDQSTAEACSNMWKGIKVENGSTLVVAVASINDAQYAIDAVDGSTIGLYASTFDRNFVTIHIADNTNWPYYNVVGHIITDCTFDCTSNLHAPFTGQTPAPGSKSFAAVDAHEVDLDFTPMSGNLNHFQNLSNGIVAFKSNLTIANCDFTNIQKDNAYSASYFNGSGIYANGATGYYYLHQTGYGLNSTPSFSGCYRGIYTESMNVHSSDNRMENMDWGYRVDYSTHKTVDILSNYIRSHYTAVDLRMNDNAAHLLVQGNQIHFGLPSVGFGRGIAAINVVEQNGSHDDSRINSNYIWHVAGAPNAALGISMTSSSYYFVTNNEVHLADNLLNKTGISSDGCDHDEVSCNIVTGPGTNFDVAVKDQSAYKFTMGDYHTISCNTSNGTTNGFYFSGYPYTTDIKGNDIDFHKYGLQLDFYTIIGTQKWKGNKWNYAPATGGKGAFYLNALNAGNYKFVYDNTSSPGAVAEPPTWDPLLWFQFLGHSNFECQINAATSYCDHFNYVPCEGCDHDFDFAIAQERIQNGDFTDPSNYELAKELWKLLDENHAYRDSFPVLDSFYVANQNGLLDKINEVREQVANLSDIAPNVNLVLVNNQSQISFSIASIAAHVNLMLNGNLDSTQMAAESLTIAALRSTIQSLLDYNQTAINLANSTQILSADNASVMNGAISGSEVFTQNEQQVNEIYLATVARGINTFTPVQASILYSIAIQCPLAGGNSVWKARALYSLIDDEATYNDAIACLNAGIALRQLKDSSSLSELQTSTSVYPNPATDRATLRYNLPDNTVGQFVISDAFGKEVYRYTLNSKSNQFDFSTTTMAQSVYYYKVFSNDTLVGIGKISIIK